MRRLISAFAWYWIILVATPIAFMLWYCVRGVYEAIIYSISCDGVSIAETFRYAYGAARYGLAHYFREGVISAEVIGPAVTLASIAFVVVLLLGFFPKRKVAN